MKPLRVFTWVILAVAALLAIIALFLTIATPVGLSIEQSAQLGQIRAQSTVQCNETSVLLEEMLPVSNRTETVDTVRLPALQQCEQYIRDGNPALKNASAVRLEELMAFNVSQLDVVLEGLNSAAVELEALASSRQYTGVITTHQSGIVNGNIPSLPYELRSMMIGGENLYYIEIPASTSLFVVMDNITTVVFEDWVPSIGTGCDNCNRVDSIMDRQEEKIMSTPTPILFQSRSYPNGTSVSLSGLNTVMEGDFIGITDAVHISF